MAYTPELSRLGSATLRRLAWYMGKPMTKSLEMLIGMTAMKMAEVKPGEVCSKCRDDRICDWCPSNSNSITNPSINSSEQTIDLNTSVSPRQERGGYL